MSNISFSKSDSKRHVRIPNDIDGDISELVGVIFGDGCLFEHKASNKTIIDISGDKDGDEEFHKFISRLFHKKFGIRLISYDYGTWVQSRIHSKAVFSYFTKTLNLKTGNKNNSLEIPKLILENDLKFLRFMRGFADTDFCLTFQKRSRKRHYYPIIKTAVNNRKLIEQIAKKLLDLGFKVHTEYDRLDYDKRSGKYYKKSYLFLNGKDNLLKWIHRIGFKNGKHMTKYQVWKKFGFCPPKTTLEQRKLILQNSFDPESFYNQ